MPDHPHTITLPPGVTADSQIYGAPRQRFDAEAADQLLFALGHPGRDARSFELGVEALKHDEHIRALQAKIDAVAASNDEADAQRRANWIAERNAVDAKFAAVVEALQDHAAAVTSGPSFRPSRATPDERDAWAAQQDDEAQRINALFGTDAGGGQRSRPASRSTTSAGGFCARVFGAGRTDRRRPGGTSFRSFAEFASCVARGHSHPELYSNSGMNTGHGADGGFAVPVQFSARLLDMIAEQSFFLSNGTVIPIIEGGSATFPAFQDEDRTSGGAAGLKGEWIGEATKATRQTAKLKAINLQAKKLQILLPASYELLQDALPGSDKRLMMAMATAAARDLDAAFVAGTGAGQPLGVVNSPAAISVAKESAQAADSIRWENVTSMAARLSPSSFSRSVWMVHPSCLPQLLSLQIIFLSGETPLNGQRVEVLAQDSSGLTLLTRPVLLTEACAPLGDLGDIILMDPSEYVIGLREDITLDRSTDFYFDSDEIALRLRVRVDGQPIASAPQTARGGGSTNSPFVTLAARA